MSLSPGSTLGPYQVDALIGAGGMGEVYRAIDPRLGRDVAIKISTEPFSERFEREARAVAALNHPNVCTVHDVGPNYLVMELIEGATLAEKLRLGPLPTDEALRISTEIAAALEAAHERGIIHRDLKPGNIKIRPDGSVKVLDFGLARIGTNRSVDPEKSPPTVTAGLTDDGVVLGTAAYMSPEQARGTSVDKRTDVWAFGCVLYEMLTGRRAFAGRSFADIVGAVMKDEPNWNALPVETPTLVRSIVRRCLQKDPARRLRDVADARLEILEALTDSGAALESTRQSGMRWTRVIPWVLVAISSAAAVVGFARVQRTEIPNRLQVIGKVGVAPSGAPMLAVAESGSLAYLSETSASHLVWVSRDGVEEPLSDDARQYFLPRVAPGGKRLVVSAGEDLWLQETDRPALIKLTTDETTGNLYPVWTRDGKQVVIRTHAGLYLLDADGSGRAQRIPKTSGADYPHSLTPDGETLLVLRTTVDRGPDLYILSLHGDPNPRPLVSTSAHEGGGQFSPDGKWFAYTSDEAGHFQVLLRPFPQGERKWLVAESGKYVAWNRTGQELFYRDGTKLFSVDLSIKDGQPVLSTPRLLFDRPYEFGIAQTTANYDVDVDGRRFLMVKGAAGVKRLSVVLNGFEDVSRLRAAER